METKEITEIVNQLPQEQRLGFRDSIVALINAIPYAGSSIGYLVSTYRDNRRIAKVCETIKELSDKISQLQIDPSGFLTEDQAVEIFERSIEGIAKNSNKDKISWLKRCLINSYTQEDVSFNEKDVFLNICDSLTSNEIIILKAIYIDEDNFIKKEYPQEGQNIGNVALNLNLAPSVLMYSPQPGTERYEDGSQTLRSYIESLFSQAAMSIPALAQTDSKGLTDIKTNLESSIIKKIYMAPTNPLSPAIYSNQLTSITSIASLSMYEDRKPTQTPIEASRTEFGKRFINFIENN